MTTHGLAVSSSLHHCRHLRLYEPPQQQTQQQQPQQPLPQVGVLMLHASGFLRCWSAHGMSAFARQVLELGWRVRLQKAGDLERDCSTFDVKWLHNAQGTSTTTIRPPANRPGNLHLRWQPRRHGDGVAVSSGHHCLQTYIQKQTTRTGKHQAKGVLEKGLQSQVLQQVCLSLCRYALAMSLVMQARGRPALGKLLLDSTPVATEFIKTDVAVVPTWRTSSRVVHAGKPELKPCETRQGPGSRWRWWWCLGWPHGCICHSPQT